MASLPPFRQMQFAQVVGAPPWFANFLQTLNQFLAATYDTVNKNTDLVEQVPAQVVTQTVAVGPTGIFAAPQFKFTLQGSPTAVLLARTVCVSGNLGTSAISLNQWSLVAGMIKVESLVGLQPDNTYQLTFLVL